MSVLTKMGLHLNSRTVKLYGTCSCGVIFLSPITSSKCSIVLGPDVELALHKLSYHCNPKHFISIQIKKWTNIFF